MSEEKFIFDSLQDSQTIREFISTLNEGFEKGRIVLSSDGEKIVLSPKGLLGFSVKAKKKRGESKISIKVEWKDREPGVVSTSSGAIRIES